jgi:hypothetical protein
MARVRSGQDVDGDACQGSGGLRGDQARDELDQKAVTGVYYRRRSSRIVLVELWGGAT